MQILVVYVSIFAFLELVKCKRVVPPALPKRERRQSEGENGEKFETVKNIGKNSGFDLKNYKEKTAISEEGRKVKKPDVKPFKIKYSSISLKIQAFECVFAHNEIRRRHGLDEMLWDIDLSYGAKEWAAVLAARDDGIQHSSQENSDYYYGENIFWQGALEHVTANCSNAVNHWYKEIENFDYQSPTWSFDNGHFAQLVWPKAVRFGVGLAFTSEGTIYIVGRYLSGVQKSGLDTIPKPLNENSQVTISSLTPKKSPEPLVQEVYLNPGGGWTPWIPISACSETCGEDSIRLEVRYCIDTSSTTVNPGNCEGNKTRVVSCGKLVPCPGQDDLNEKDGVCEDLETKSCQEKVVPKGGRHECRRKEDNKWMSQNCKKTCKFCTPCMNYHKDCTAYASPPYKFCTNDTYSPWMEWKCAKTCGYCNMNQTQFLEDDCYDLTNDCVRYATEFGYCRDTKYTKWMQEACKESCGFCRECEDKILLCKKLSDNFAYCIDSMYSSYMYKLCGKSCGYCFDGNLQKDIDSIKYERPPKL